MLENKANKILNGDKNEKVTYKNKLVWIEHVNDKTGEALVSIMDTGEKMTVPISELESKGSGLK